MEFIKVFDIADSGYRSYGFAANGLIFIVIGILYFYSPKILTKFNLLKSTEEAGYQKSSRYFFLGFALLWTTISFLATYTGYQSLKNASCRMVEGEIENFDPMPHEGHRNEIFSVQGINFGYSDYSVTNGFNNTASHGGPITADSYVRICYVPQGNGNVIVRLEIRDYKGPIKDYSGGYDFFSMSEQLKEDSKSGKTPKFPKNVNEAMRVANKYMVFLTPILIIDFVLYLLMFVPFFRVFIKVKEIWHPPLDIDRKFLDQEKHSFGNLTVKYEDKEILWGRPYGIGIFHWPGCVLKMYLSFDNSQIIRSEIRMSSLMLLTACVISVMIVQFFSAVIDGASNVPSGVVYFPYIIFAMVALSLWMLKRNFEKKVLETLKPN